MKQLLFASICIFCTLLSSCSKETTIESLDDVKTIAEDIEKENPEKADKFQAACMAIGEGNRAETNEAAEVKVMAIIKGKTVDEVIAYAKEHHDNIYDLILVKMTIADSNHSLAKETKSK